VVTPPDCAGFTPSEAADDAALEDGAVASDDIPDDPGAMFPGEACGAGVDIAAFGAPVGAGEAIEVWAIATPAVIQNAAEASRAKRIKFS
jgi:hypothetical protein